MAFKKWIWTPQKVYFIGYLELRQSFVQLQYIWIVNDHGYLHSNNSTLELLGVALHGAQKSFSFPRYLSQGFSYTPSLWKVPIFNLKPWTSPWRSFVSEWRAYLQWKKCSSRATVWAWSIDVYLSVTIAKEHRKFLMLVWQGRTFQFTYLPFSLCSAP